MEEGSLDKKPTDAQLPPANTVSDPVKTDISTGNLQIAPIPDTSEKPWLKKLPLILGIAVTVLLIFGAGYYFRQKYLKQRAETTESPKAVFDLGGAVFAEYKEIKSTVKPSLPEYTLAIGELSNLSEVASSAKIQVDSQKTSALERQGFFLQPTKAKYSDPDAQIYLPSALGGRSDDMIDLYSTIGGSNDKLERKPENAVFITSDFLLHVYHVLIDRTFQKIEEVKLQPTLKQLTQKLYEDSLVSYNQEEDPEIKESLARLTAFYLVPLVILDSSTQVNKDYFGPSQDQEASLAADQSIDSKENITDNLNRYKDNTPSEIFQLATDELDLLLQASQITSSPLFGNLKPDSPEDYTQYKPRGHYTKSSLLRSYFRAMMWYGRHGFDLKSEDLTRDALVMTWQLGSSTIDEKGALELWEYIYLPTVFFVGRSDDLTFYEYSSLISKIYGGGANLSAFSDETKLQSFREEAQKLEGPNILSEVKVFDPGNAPTKEELLQSTKGFRFMGQRFIPDSYMFSSLTQGDELPDPETGQKLPSTPTAIMIMSVLGSKTADTLLDEWVATQAPNSDKVIGKVMNLLKSEFGKFSEKTWTQNIYWAWLYNFLPLFEEHSDGYPMFMRNSFWSKKSLLSALGSWTELRHDTLLYAKQSYAELGGGRPDNEPPPVPRGYVEPNMSFLTRLIALNNMTKEGLEAKDLLIPGQKEKFAAFGEALEFFKTIAEKELSNSEISDDDFERLRTIVRFNFPYIVWGLDGDIMREKDARMGIIADVHTDAYKKQILYEATGTPSIIYVAVKDKNGTRLTRGAVYSYYEFAEPLGSRLTDEDWQARIYEEKDQDKIPQTPDWTEELIVP